jgi:hypothetical protein
MEMDKRAAWIAWQLTMEFSQVGQAMKAIAESYARPLVKVIPGVNDTLDPDPQDECFKLVYRIVNGAMHAPLPDNPEFFEDLERANRGLLRGPVPYPNKLNF